MVRNDDFIVPADDLPGEDDPDVVAGMAQLEELRAQEESLIELRVPRSAL